MSLALIRALANRSNFKSLFLQSDDAFNPVVPSADAAAIRTAMHLGVGNDYYVMGPVILLASCPAAASLLPSPFDWEILKDFQWSGFSINNGWQLQPDQNGPPNIARRIDYWPAETGIDVSYYSADIATVVSGNQSALIPVSVVGSQVYPTWPSWSGLTGSLYPQSGGWGTDTLIHIELPPINYPSSKVLEAVQCAGNAMIDLLNKKGLLGYYSGVSDPEERLALIGAALIMDSNG